jgi:predicted Zn-dependent protease
MLGTLTTMRPARKPDLIPTSAALATAALAATWAACSTVPETGRRQLNLVPQAELASIGLTEFEKYKQSTPVSSDPAKNAAVRRVAARLTPVIPMPGAQWEFVVFDDPSPNAFALPGGKVGVNTGIFQVAENDAGLATVIGHEVAHVVANHGGERLSQGLVASGAGVALGIVLGQNDSLSDAQRAGLLAAYGAGATAGVILPFSRHQELEADRIGTIYMARAGYEPREAVAFWERFARYKESTGSGGKLPEFLSTHPLDSRRIDALRAFLPAADAEYRRATGN